MAKIMTHNSPNQNRAVGLTSAAAITSPFPPYPSGWRVLPPITHCKCGTIPTIGCTFWYHSKYGSVVEGIVKDIDGFNITSTAGVTYPKDQIEIKPLHIIRDEKLGELGIG